MKDCIGALIVTMPSDREIVMTRSFNAPRSMVWDAMTKPELLTRWLTGPDGWRMAACEVDLRAGGEFRWEWRGPNGEAMSMRGVYREVVPPERLVRTESFQFALHSDSGKGGEQVGTLVLTEQDGDDDGGGASGGTKLTLTVLHSSKKACDAAIASGVEHGMAAGYDKLAELLAAMLNERGSLDAA